MYVLRESAPCKQGVATPCLLKTGLNLSSSTGEHACPPQEGSPAAERVCCKPTASIKYHLNTDNMKNLTGHLCLYINQLPFLHPSVQPQLPPDQVKFHRHLTVLSYDEIPQIPAY